MASYETEHATDPPRSPSSPPPRRPDLSTFLSLLSSITPNDPATRSRPQAVPIPAEISATYRSLAEAFETMRQSNTNADSDLLDTMISTLTSSATSPPKDVPGVDDEYVAKLERVPAKRLKRGSDCPICGERFADDPHPLVVRLPCHPNHIFDLECIAPWLRLNGTCPLDRVDLAAKERSRKEERLAEIKRNAKPEDEEEEWDGLYG